MATLRCRLRGHPPDQIELSPPDRHHWHVARCRRCNRRWATYDTTVSDEWIQTLREVGDAELPDRLEAANARYREQRARHESRRVGDVRGRSTVPDPVTGKWARRDTSTGRFEELKRSGGSFRSVRREN